MNLKINGIDIKSADGKKYIDLVREQGLEKGALGVAVRGETISLNAHAISGADVRVLTLADEEGRRIYERTLQFVLLAAARRATPDLKLRIEHSFGDGLYVHAQSGAITPAQVQAIWAGMEKLIDADAPIVRISGTKAEALEYFRATGQDDKLRLMKYRNHEHFVMYALDGMQEYFYGEMAPSAGYVRVSALRAYYPGMVLMMPDTASPDRVAPFRDMPKLARTFAQSARWNAILGVSNAADLNEMAESRRLREFIRVNEALHERSVQKIADEFAASGARVVLIAGPSSSGKTTFSHRLLIALRVLGYRPVKLSLDDYYIDRSLVPIGEDGRRDLERIDILDLELLNEHLLQLIQGETIQAPEFDFVTGTRKSETHPMRVEAGQPIIIEGIHGLNDALSSDIPSELKFRVYVSALTQLNLDCHNRIRTTDVRLMRRMVRDHRTRATNALETMQMWDKVRAGEEKYIFPFQEKADVMFNTSLLYEIAVLKKYAYPLLREIGEDSPYYTRARRLCKFLHYFKDMDEESEIPPTSILREFIGGCTFYGE